VPQRIWLPLPKGTGAENVALYYYHCSGKSGDWYPAENVQGWLVPDSCLTMQIDGITYLGFVVTHSATIQLRLNDEAAPISSASVIPFHPKGEGGDLLLMLLFAAILVSLSKSSPKSTAINLKTAVQPRMDTNKH
jgi:hypothetical protein